MDVSMAGAAAGVTSAIGAACLLGYFFSETKPEQTDRSIVDVAGHRDTREQVLQVIAGLTTDEAKLRALKDYYGFDDAQAERVLRKVKSNVDVNAINRNASASRDKRYLIAAITFIVLAAIALLAEFGTRRDQVQQPVPAPTQGPSTPASTPAVAPAASAPVPRPAPVYVGSWEGTGAGGIAFTKVFSVPTDNRHHLSNAGATATYRVTDLPDPPGFPANSPKRITRAVFRCDGDKCPWSYTRQGNADRDTGDFEYDPATAKQWVTWHRRWDGDAHTETYTVYYDVFRRICSANCP